VEADLKEVVRAKPCWTGLMSQALHHTRPASLQGVGGVMDRVEVEKEKRTSVPAMDFLSYR
jgi:hypothetical protein